MIPATPCHSRNLHRQGNPEIQTVDRPAQRAAPQIRRIFVALRGSNNSRAAGRRVPAGGAYNVARSAKQLLHALQQGMPTMLSSCPSPAGVEDHDFFGRSGCMNCRAGNEVTPNAYIGFFSRPDQGILYFGTIQKDSRRTPRLPVINQHGVPEVHRWRPLAVGLRRPVLENLQKHIEKHPERLLKFRPKDKTE